MQPHMHPGSEKIENIQILKGVAAIVYFDDQGCFKKSVIISPDECERVEVPAFTWHTYVMLTNEVITYETMNGIYDPMTWKSFPAWAPAENTVEALEYFKWLRDLISEF